MKIEIEQQLRRLLGVPLQYAGRASDLLWLGFGGLVTIKRRNGTQEEKAEYSLHIQCSWRITKENKIVVASSDIYIPGEQWNKSEEKFDWDKPGANRFDELIKKFSRNRSSKLIIKAIEADDIGGVKVVFTEGYVLEIFPDRSTGDEFWRFFISGNLDSHFVVTGKGIEED